jgi:hypothetical protein
MDAVAVQRVHATSHDELRCRARECTAHAISGGTETKPAATSMVGRRKA